MDFFFGVEILSYVPRGFTATKMTLQSDYESQWLMNKRSIK